MSTDVMKERITETSPQVYARIGGVLYLIIIVIGFCSEFFVRDKLVVSGDVTATANNIMAFCLNRRIVILPVAHGEGRERTEVERESTPGVWLIFFMTFWI